MRQRLQFEKRRVNEKLAGKELKEDDEYQRLKKRKTDVLDRIFRSMANLVFFFQCIAEHPEMAEVFDDDIKDLLGIRREDPQKVLGFAFLELVCAILMIESKSAIQGSEDEKPHHHHKDFRLYLNHLLQIVTNEKVRMFVGDVFNNVHAHGLVREDFMRAWAWTRMLADTVDLDTENEISPHRTFDFETKEIFLGRG